MKVRACVNCGYCCKKSACAFGIYDNVNKQCVYLKMDEDNNSSCSIYGHIITQPFAEFNPAFGQGCCSAINILRHNKILDVYDGIEQYITIRDIY